MDQKTVERLEKLAETFGLDDVLIMAPTDFSFIEIDFGPYRDTALVHSERDAEKLLRREYVGMQDGTTLATGSY